ncbi:MAG: hypothetical protein COA67_06425 [Lutibacter sp.]|nr:MAG: hypothetical protein COA67_06425 [Lutibacter sp.]
MTLKKQRKKKFYSQLRKGKKALKNKEVQTSFYHFENAHVLGQSHLFRHTLSHSWMFVWGIKTKSIREIIGQTIRIIASLLFTLIWVPKGNTGGTNLSPMKSIPIRKEIQKYFS